MNGNMPHSMVQARIDVIMWLNKTNNISEISRKTGHSRSFVRKIREQLEKDEGVFNLDRKIGAPTKKSDNVRNEILNLTLSNRRMSDRAIASIISENQKFHPISSFLVNSVRHDFKFNFLPPIHTFITTEIQRKARVEFCQNHIENGTDWSNVIFTDESSFELDSSSRWIWRRRGECSHDIYHATKKFNSKIMVFGGISKKYCTPLIAIKGSINADSYVDECIDDSGLILGMNEAYGPFQWTLMQDGATSHTAESTIRYLKNYCNILEGWPSNSPDMNPIENLWSILKRRIEELDPKTEEQLVEHVFEAWENIDILLIHNLIDSVPSRLQAVIKSEGYPT